MREFWVASGHHLTRRTDHGGLVATPELIMAYLARPELMPPADACEAERNLHASLLTDPLRPVAKGDIAVLADAEARENWTFMMNFRDRLVAAPSLEAVYVNLARNGAGDLPPIFLSQLCHLILRNALEGCDDPYTLRAAELFYRSQQAAVHEGTLLLADAEIVEAQQHAEHDLHSSPLTAMLAPPKAFGEMDVMDDENAWTYWSRSDAHAMAMNIGGNSKARDGLCRVIERWITHLLGVAASVETVASIEDRDWRWFVGLDSEGTKIGNALWNGGALDASAAERIVALMRLSISDTRLVDERVGSRPVYLILAMGADKVVRLKPQNLVVALPIKYLEAASRSPAAVPLLRVPVGVVVARRKAESLWGDFVWRGIGILPDEPEMEPWTVLREQDEATFYYAGSATVDLYRSETQLYRDNIAFGSPSVWIVLSPSEGRWPYAISAVTANPAEGEAYTETGANLVEAVAMPEMLREAIESFIAEHHVEREFVKRERRRADPEALARRQHEGGRE